MPLSPVHQPDILLADGIGIVWFTKMLKGKNVNGLAVYEFHPGLKKNR